jgi:hypothetical protein
MGKPQLPADLPGIVKTLNGMLIAMSKQLPPTDPSITTCTSNASDDTSNGF